MEDKILNAVLEQGGFVAAFTGTLVAFCCSTFKVHQSKKEPL